MTLTRLLFGVPRSVTDTPFMIEEAERVASFETENVRTQRKGSGNNILLIRIWAPALKS